MLRPKSSAVVPAHRGQWSLGLFLGHAPPYSLRQGLLWNTQLTDLARLEISKQTPETLLSLFASAGVTEGRCPSWGLRIQTQFLGFEKHVTHEAAPPTQIAKH